MRVKMLVSMGSPIGRAYIPGKFYDLEDDEARSLIKAGFAMPGWEPTIKHLHKHGAGLLVTDSTSAELVEAARAAGLPVHVDESISGQFGWPEALMEAAQDALDAAGFTPGSIKAASDEALLAVNGVGPASVALLREVFGGPPEE